MSFRENFVKSIEKSGWHLNNQSVNDFLTETPNLNSNELNKRALNYDLRSIGSKHLPDLVISGKSENFDANSVLQLVKLRNIAAPKENEHSMAAPSMYKITLTDGYSNCNALVLGEINKLNLNTPPGTKLHLIGSIKIKSNLLILNNSNCKLLGGNVEYLVNKWKQAKDLSQHVRVMNLTDTAPPPWVPFGFQQANQVDTSKKVLAQNEKSEEDGSSEFSQARQAALAEAREAMTKVTKTFTQQTIDKTQLDNAAAAVAAAVTAKAASSLDTLSHPEKTKPDFKKGRKGRKNRFDDDEDDYREAKDAAKPSSVTLFDMFKTKLDIKDDDTINTNKEVISQDTNNYDRRGDNRYTRGGGSGRGYRGGRGGGRGGFRNNGDFVNQQQQQQNQKKNQTYDKDDFSYDLGDTTKVKDLINLKTVSQSEMTAKIDSLKSTKAPLSTTTTTTTTTTSTNKPYEQRTNYYNPTKSNNIVYNDNNSYSQNKKPHHNTDNTNFQPKSYQKSEDRQSQNFNNNYQL